MVCPMHISMGIHLLCYTFRQYFIPDVVSSIIIMLSLYNLTDCLSLLSVFIYIFFVNNIIVYCLEHFTSIWILILK